MKKMRKLVRNTTRKCTRIKNRVVNFFRVERVEHGPIPVRELRMMYYYSSMGLLILGLLIILIGMLIMINNDITLKELLYFDGKTEKVLFWIHKIKSKL